MTLTFIIEKHKNDNSIVSILISVIRMELSNMSANTAQFLSIRSHGGGWVGLAKEGQELRCSYKISSLPYVIEIEILSFIMTSIFYVILLFLPYMLVIPAQSLSIRSHGGGWVGLAKEG